MSLFPSLIEAVRRNNVRTNSGRLNFTREQLNRLASLQHYDLGGMFQRGHPDDIGLDEIEYYRNQIDADIASGFLPLNDDDISIEFLWTVRGHVISHIVPTPGRASLEAATTDELVTCFSFHRGLWHLDAIDAELTCMVAKRIIEDAELNVEFVERLDVETERVNRGRARGGLPPIKTTRIISLSNIRKQYLGGPRGPHQGGTHARPREHTRVISDREIVCKDGRRYRRKAQVVTVNRGITRSTKVVR